MARAKTWGAVFAFAMATTCFTAIPVSAAEGAAQNAPPSSKPANPQAKDTRLASTDDLVAQFGIKFRRYQLDNGLTVILNDADGAKDVYVEVVYRVGSKDEPSGRSGFAHLFEHLMFQGTANRKGEYFEALEGFGAVDINGTTTNDRTNFFQVVAPGALDRVLWLESDRMQYLMGGVTQEELDRQRAVVKNEKRESEVGDSFEAEAQLLQAYYPEGHPYRHSVIGSMADLDAATLEDVAAWYKRYYGAANAIIVVSGDIDLDDVAARVERYFSDVRPGKRITTVDQWVPGRESVGRIKGFAEIEAPSITRTWPLPNNDARDTILLSAFVAMLDARKSELPITKRLVENDGPLESFGWSVLPAEVASEFELSFDLKKGVSLETAEARFQEEFALLLESGITKADIDAFVESTRIDFVKALVDPTIVPASLVQGELFHDDPLALLKHMQLVANAAPGDFHDAARRWLKRPYFEQLALPGGRPQDEAQTPKTAARVDRSAMPPVDLTVADQVFPTVETATLDSGARLVVSRIVNHPIIEGAITFDLGYGYGNDLTQEFLFGFMNYGGQATASLGAEAFARRNQDLHANIYPTFSESGLQYRFTAVSPRTDEVVDLAAQVVKNPVFDAERIAKDNRKNSETKIDDTIKVGGEQVLRMALWGDQHPWGKLPKSARPEPVSGDALKLFHQNHLAPANMIVYLSGNISMAEARPLVEAKFAEWRKGASTKAADNVPPPQTMSPRIILLDSPGAAQAQITAARLIPAYTSATGPAQRLANMAIGGGFISRINLNLREAKGWSYGAKTELDQNPAAPQTLSINARVEADKTAQSIAEIVREMREYVSDRPITAEEFGLARDNYLAELRAFNLTPASVLEMLMQADQRKAPYDYLNTLPRQYEELTLDDVRGAARDMFNPEGLIWVISGDLSVIEAPIRALGVAPVEVRNEQGAVIR